MGCVVNGPGESKMADVGVAGGKGKGAIYRAGELVGTYPENELLGMLRLEIEKVIAEKYPAYLEEIGGTVMIRERRTLRRAAWRRWHLRALLVSCVLAFSRPIVDARRRRARG